MSPTDTIDDSFTPEFLSPDKTKDDREKKSPFRTEFEAREYRYLEGLKDETNLNKRLRELKLLEEKYKTIITSPSKEYGQDIKNIFIHLYTETILLKASTESAIKVGRGTKNKIDELDKTIPIPLKGKV